MKRMVVVLLLLSCSFLLHAQVHLTLTGPVSDGTIVSGETLSWDISVPTGATVRNQLWLDIDENGHVNPGPDRLMFLFDQQDGAPGYDGPADNDGVANGIISTAFPAGLAPFRWIMVVTHASGSDTAAFVVTPLQTPAATITGTLTAPTGYSPAYFIVEASPDMESSGMSPFWHGLTDMDGHYTIAMGGDPTTLNPWRVHLPDGGAPVGRLIALRRDTVVTVGGPSPVVDFSLIEGTVLTGRVLDQNQQPVAGAHPHTHDPVNIEDNAKNFGGNLDANGYFSFIVPPGSYKLHFTAGGYFDSWWNNVLDFNSATVIAVTNQDTIRNLNGTMTQGGSIAGQVRNWGEPVNAQVTIYTTDHNPVWMTQTGGDGQYNATLVPGSYVIEFMFGGQTQYYDHQYSWPGNTISISGTESYAGVDGDFTVGPPPNMPSPEIVHVWDYPFDNGRQVYIKWTGVDAAFMAMNAGFSVQAYSIWRLDGPDTVFMRSVPPAGQWTYTTVVGTLKDSTKTEGMFTSVFIVRAHLTLNLMVLSSAPASGYSLDNLAPGVPAGIGSVVSGQDVVIRWLPNEEEDFKYYTVYRSVSPDMSPSTVLPFAYTVNTEFRDVGAAVGTYYYRITATDHAGNESGTSLPVSSSGTVAVNTCEGMPASFALNPNYPNPFNPSTAISFDLPERAHVRIVVYNALGEEVATVVAREMGAGSHTATFDASDLPSGLYICRMQAGPFVSVRKMSLVR